MRARNLKPNFFKNDRLAELPPLARLLYQGLWCLADREGRLEDRPLRIKAEILPYDKCDINALLDTLADAGFIRRYGPGYIDIPKFKCHQNPHHHEKASIIPAYSDIGTKDVQVVDLSHTNPAESPILNPESLYKTLVHRTATNGRHVTQFVNFWALYPKKQDKGHAERAWAKAVRDTSPQEIIEGLENQLHTLAARERQFIPLASTWLNGKRWSDEPEPKPGENKPVANVAARKARIARAKAELARGDPDGAAHNFCNADEWAEIQAEGAL
jgi:hypothetical protein